MNNTEKGLLINAILQSLKIAYHAALAKYEKYGGKEPVHFDPGDTFFSLAFKDEKELRKIAKLCGI